MRRRTIWQRIRWKRIGICVLAICVISAGTAGIYHEASKARKAMHPQIKYTMIAKKGSTLWDLCKNIDCEYSTGYLVWLAMEQNHLKSAYNLQDGQQIEITLKK